MSERWFNLTKEKSMSRNQNTNGTLNPYTAGGADIQPGDHFGYKVIAVIHSEHFWTAYLGLTDWSDVQIASNGDTLSHKTAALLFPTIDAVIPNYNL